MSLRRYLTGLIWLCMLPLLLVAVLIMSEMRTDRARQWRAAEDVATGIAYSLDTRLTSSIEALETLARLPGALDATRRADLYQHAIAVAQRFGAQIALADASGQMVFSTREPLGSKPAQLPELLGQSSLMQALQSGEPAMGKVFEGLSGSGQMVSLAVPVPDPAAQARPSVLIATFDTRRLDLLLESVLLPEHYGLRLVDANERVMAQRAWPTEVPEQRVQRVVGGERAHWTVEVSWPSGKDHAPLDRFVWVLSLLLVAATIAGMLGGAWAARRLARELSSVAEADKANEDESRFAEVATTRQRLRQLASDREHAERDRIALEAAVRRNIEEAKLDLEVREAQLRGILDSADDAIITCDAQQLIVMANPAAAAMFGVSLDRLIGAPLDHLVPPQHRAAHRTQVHAFGESGISARHMGGELELTGLRADGTEFPIDAAISRVHIDGKRLFTVIVRDMTERRRAERRLRESQERLTASHTVLRRLVSAQDQIQEKERGRISRELHDDLQQTLAAIIVEVAALRGELAQRELEPMLDRLDGLAATAIESTRRIVQDLRPQSLEDLGLAAALSALAERFSKQTGIHCTLEVSPELMADERGTRARRADETATCLYRVAQEALTNVGKHAGARHVRMALAAGVGEGSLVLRVSDDGKGLNQADDQKPDSLGLVGMRERVLALDGTLRLSSEPGRGTTLEAEIPG
jgi:PAS domain S-box-containing protein